MLPGFTSAPSANGAATSSAADEHTKQILQLCRAIHVLHGILTAGDSPMHLETVARPCGSTIHIVLKAVLVTVAGARQPAAAGAASSSKAAGHSRGGKGRPSNGTGYGGGGGYDMGWGAKQEANPGAAQAAERQKGIDRESTAQLTDIRNLLSQVHC